MYNIVSMTFPQIGCRWCQPTLDNLALLHIGPQFLLSAAPRCARCNTVAILASDRAEIRIVISKEPGTKAVYSIRKEPVVVN